MKVKHSILFLIFVTFTAQAKTKVDMEIRESVAPGSCSVAEAWKGTLGDAIRQQLAFALNESGLFNVVESEYYRAQPSRGADDGSGVSTVHKKRTFRAAQYSIEGSLKTFNACDTASKQSAEVVMEFRVIDVATGEVEHKFTSRATMSGPLSADYKGAAYNSGLFRDSALGMATRAAVGEAADRLKRAFPEQEVASNGYAVKTIRKSRKSN